MTIQVKDQVFRLRDGWYCIVDGKMHGMWAERGYAEAGMQTEQRRAYKKEGGFYLAEEKHL